MKQDIEDKFAQYPDHVKLVLFDVRSLILDLADEHQLGEVEESLKWGQLSYRVSGGSPVRFDWNAQYPQQFSIFMNCNTKLVDTFRELHSDILVFQGNREIVLKLGEPLPMNTLKQCMFMALTYHRIRNLPLLGA
ncbi:DUF1801 domain-containing protein [Shewanella sp. D64]|uniref:DUF1801 domain-containing protein n=1 Tax=unclassified Shewanella TaxID=196818 RepID=UPI0022BA39EF|nr:MULTISPECIES: DUF1801 domain-containing protein [unclassified Shewanella]MEC4725357.1 DUF1801 domain-containing protein [Shewanella sp. D64]MEC4735797.1 DUF1801 domain-containing protein [Shewanella sp. E94]WBJ93232.1 DUF1801 domain-containing protein [Shewanella sp. MTB7]